MIWGIKEYEHRFGKKPEGLWLPETAVDRKSLDILAELGIKFTILAPHQAAKFRKIGEQEWIEASKGMDLRRAYLCRLDSGRTISLFFYDGLMAKDVAFTNMLDNGENFANRLLSGLTGDDSQLVHIAADGETFGHHHPGGDMALAYCLYHIESKNLAKITVYGEYLEKYPPTFEVEIVDNTSWSCPHGVGRWMTDCGCNSGGHPAWNQAWRTPLRQTLDLIRDTLVPVYEHEGKVFFKDPWAARDDYIHVILNRSPENVESFLSKHATRTLSPEEKVKALRLLEMQRHAMLMYTSDGWFFDEISGLETTQIMKYASRAMQLAREVNGIDLEPVFIDRLKQAKSNLQEFGDGEKIYLQLVKPAALDLLRVAAHYAIASLFNEFPERVRIFCYIVSKESYALEKVGEESLAVGKIRVRSDITWEEEILSFAALHFSGHNLVGGAQRFKGDDPHSQMQTEIKEAFAKGDIPEVIRLIDKHFGSHSYTIWHLFRDEQRRILSLILKPDQKEIDSFFHQAYTHHYPALQVMRDLKVPFPEIFQAIVRSVIDSDLHNSFESEKINLTELRKLVNEVRKFAPQIDRQSLDFLASRTIEGLMESFSKNPDNLAQMQEINELLDIEYDLSLQPPLWKSQNILFSISRKLRQEMNVRADKGDQKAKRWLELMESLENRMQVRTY